MRRLENGTRRDHPRGYVLIRVDDHPRYRKAWVYEHVLVAERALGKILPAGAVVHHVDDNPANNLPSNLVVCQNQAYHLLLHARARVKRAGGIPGYHYVCAACQQLKPLSTAYFSMSNGRPANGLCRPCDSIARWKRYKPKTDRKRPGPNQDKRRCDWSEKRYVNGVVVIFRCVKQYGHDDWLDEGRPNRRAHRLKPDA